MDELTEEEKEVVVSVMDYRIEKLGDYKVVFTGDKEKIEWANNFIAKMEVIKEKLKAE